MDKIKNYLNVTPYFDFDISVASEDASFRKYYRLTKEGETYLLMDASLEKDSLKLFLDVTKKLQHAEVNVPKIYTQNLTLGYLILEDFGDTHLLRVLDKNNYKTLYKQAIEELLKIQHAEQKGLPLYDKAFLHFEMNLMQEWYLEKKLSLKLTNTQSNMLQKSLDAISEVVLSQPQDIFVHRDYHSRNIMLKQNAALGIIDYQDAMSGSLTYDLVSLLKDCYIEFASDEIEQLALYFKEKTVPHADDKVFLKWFDFTGMQRHIKVLGVFSRLSLRDNKEGYLKDIPLTRKYLIQTAKKYKETQQLGAFLEEFTQ